MTTHSVLTDVGGRRAGRRPLTPFVGGVIVLMLAAVAPLPVLPRLLLGLGLVAILVMLPRIHLLAFVLVSMQVGTAATWAGLAKLGAVQLFAFDLVLLVAAVRVVLQQAPPRATPTPATWQRRLVLLLGAIVAWSVVVQTLALIVRGPGYFLASTATFLRMAGEAGLLVSIFAHGVRSVADARYLTRTVLWLIATQAAFGLFQFIAPGFGIGPEIVSAFSSTKFTNYYGTFAFRAIGFIGSGRDLAGLINIAAVGWLAVLLYDRRVPRATSLIVLAVLGAGLLRSLSKFEYVVLAAAFLAFAVLAGRRRMVIACALLLAVAPVLLPRNAREGFQVEIGPARTMDVESSSIGSRLIIWKLHMLPLVEARPITGNGWGVEAYDRSNPFGLSGAAHNQYLQWAAAVGLVGLGLILALLVSIGRCARRLWSEAVDVDLRVLGALMWGAVLTMSLSGLYSDVFNPGTGTSRMFWSLTGLLYGAIAFSGGTALTDGRRVNG